MTMAAADKKPPEHGVTFDFTVDDEPFSTHERVLTPEQILAIAGLDPDTHYLVVVTGRAQHKLEPGEEVHMHEHMVFVSGSKEPTPTS